MSFTYCPLRMSADMCIFLSFPVLLYRIRTKGATGVSLSTQFMHCFAFFARYLDLFFKGGELGAYLTWMKIYILIAAITTVHSLLTAQRPFSTHEANSILSQVFATTSICLLLGSFLSYSPPFSNLHLHLHTDLVEVAWAFSVYLAAVADVPQLMEYDRMERKDTLLTAYLVLCFAFRALYLPHLVLRYLDQGLFDVISIFGGLVQTSIYIIYGLFIVLHHSRRQAIVLDAESVATSLNGNASPLVKEALVDEKSAALVDDA
ncbi:uncharacterized protein STEHIDRAFT_134250 [Stereum hirsutum FP-91666 SS1]|uniref:uncharacterized protein n=1 Tax=Stereum hirsutum (strain FP-91666) TaxID=721885 RepID=UPI000444A063|nr:uncharacterized protein STEHIDRAFT_134250 [Stereum hirsutum FP-91666 SS1]EIM81955.1 hypothetical protein STEHIDRAFT_134250 [Stereum hirsutum FP-91666 SS1]